MADNYDRRRASTWWHGKVERYDGRQWGDDDIGRWASSALFKQRPEDIDSGHALADNWITGIRLKKLSGLELHFEGRVALMGDAGRQKVEIIVSMLFGYEGGQIKVRPGSVQARFM